MLVKNLSKKKKQSKSDNQEHQVIIYHPITGFRVVPALPKTPPPRRIKIDHLGWALVGFLVGLTVLIFTATLWFLVEKL